MIVLVDGSPCWASSAPDLAVSKSGREARGHPGPRPTGGLRRVRRVPRPNATAPGLAAIEIWNEPDQANERYFAGPDKAHHYAELLRPRIRRSSGRCAGCRSSRARFVGSNGVFLRALYAAGIKGCYDGLAVHFYTLTLARARDPRGAAGQRRHHAAVARRVRLEQVLPARTRAGGTGVRPRQGAGAEPRRACPLARAHVLRRRRRLLQAARPGDERLRRARTPRGARKPRSARLAAFALALRRPIGRVTLRLRRRGGRVSASGSGPVGDFIRIEAFRGSVKRYQALFVLDRFNRYSIELPRALGGQPAGARLPVLDRPPRRAEQHLSPNRPGRGPMPGHERACAQPGPAGGVRARRARRSLGLAEQCRDRQRRGSSRPARCDQLAM